MALSSRENLPISIRFYSVSVVVLMVRNPAANAVDARDAGLILGSGRSPGGGHGNPLQYSCLENPMERGAWWAIVQRVTKSRTQVKQLHMHTHMLFYSQGLNPTTIVQNRDMKTFFLSRVREWERKIYWRSQKLNTVKLKQRFSFIFKQTTISMFSTENKEQEILI